MARDRNEEARRQAGRERRSRRRDAMSEEPGELGRQQALPDATVTIRDTTTPPANTAPTAVPVATPSMANEQATVTLSGTGSTDPQNNITQYLWTQVSGPSVTLATPNAATTTFVTPSVPTPAGANLLFKPLE